MDLAQRLQTLRKNANYSQEQLAELLGISRQAVSKWESGQGKPEADNIVKLAELYQVSTDHILLGKPEPLGPDSKRGTRPRRGAALALLLFSYPLSLLLSALLQLAEAFLAYTLWKDRQLGNIMEAYLTQYYPLVSQPEAQRFLSIALSLLAVLLFFWDGWPKWGGKREDKA